MVGMLYFSDLDVGSASCTVCSRSGVVQATAADRLQQLRWPASPRRHKDTAGISKGISGVIQGLQ
jgi:hypothetical protein